MNRWPLLAALLLGQAVTARGAAPAFFAMDTGTSDAAHPTVETQAAMVRQLGFAGIGPTYTTPAALRATLAAADREHLKLVALYLGLEMDAATPFSPAIRDAIQQLDGRDAMLWLYVKNNARQPSDPAGDAQVVPVLREVATAAQAAGLRVALYPHAGFWVERVDDAVRLARQVDRKNVGVTFNLCHWLMVDGQDLDARLASALPNLFVVTINGADAGAKDWGHLIQPLDRGSFDVGGLLGKLAALGFSGPVGLQHFGIGGDAQVNLQRSINAWRGMQGTPLMPPGKALAAWQAAAGWSEVGTVACDPADPKRLVTTPGNGIVVSHGAAGYLLTKDPFQDCEIHVEFFIPRESNSGVYLLGSHELQIYDSHGNTASAYPGIECGGIYPEWVGEANVRGHSPRINASKPAGQWQTFDARYRAPRFDAAGRKTRNARFEQVFHNGELIHENIELLGTTRSGLPEQPAGPLRLQGDHGPVAYRNLRISRLSE